MLGMHSATCHVPHVQRCVSTVNGHKHTVQGLSQPELKLHGFTGSQIAMLSGHAMSKYKVDVTQEHAYAFIKHAMIVQTAL